MSDDNNEAIEDLENEMNDYPVTHDDAIASVFNTPEGHTIPRELMICYLNVASRENPKWCALGKRVTDSSVNFDWSDESNQDILGNVNSSMKKPVLTESFEPLNPEKGDLATEHIWKLAVMDQDYIALTAQDLLIVHFYAGDDETPFAERYPSSMVKVTSLGGEGAGSMGTPIDVTFGGARKVGTVSKNADDEVVFTPSN